MALGYPGRTNRHRLPSEVAVHLRLELPGLREGLGRVLAIIERETKNDPAAKLKYAGQIASVNNYYKNRKGMLTSYEGSDILARKTAEHNAMKAWVNATPRAKSRIRRRHRAVEKLIAERDATPRRVLPGLLDQPRFLNSARTLYRLANERTKPDAERKSGYQERDMPRMTSVITGQDRTYDEKVDKALVLNFLTKYRPSRPTSTTPFDNRPRHPRRHERGRTEGRAGQAYAGSKLANKEERTAWLKKSPADFKASNDSFIKAAVAMYDADLKDEAKEEELAGKIQKPTPAT
jgi:hypothetical protein